MDFTKVHGVDASNLVQSPMRDGTLKFSTAYAIEHEEYSCDPEYDEWHKPWKIPCPTFSLFF